MNCVGAVVKGGMLAAGLALSNYAVARGCKRTKRAAMIANFAAAGVLSAVAVRNARTGR